ncbi:MAG: LptE family protein, partial [Leeuwenhoekiella sp.]
MKNLKIGILFLTTLLLTGCGFYSFTGVSIEPGTETFQVNFFQNNAALVEPGLDRTFTFALQDLIQNQTSLSLVKNGGDLIYEGEIVDYYIAPQTATSDNLAAQNRLTITVNVRYINTKKVDGTDDFEHRFSFYVDTPGTAQLVGGALDDAVNEIFERITQDIFNESLAKW